MELIDEEEAKTLAQTTSDAEVIANLIIDNREWVRGCLAVNPHLNIENRRSLAKDGHRIVRSLTAASSFTPLEILVQLGHDPNWRVRYMVAFGKNLATVKALLSYKFATPQPYESILERLFEIVGEEKKNDGGATQELQVLVVNAYNKFSELNSDLTLQVELRKKVKEICKDSSLSQMIRA